MKTDWRKYFNSDHRAKHVQPMGAKGADSGVRAPTGEELEIINSKYAQDKMEADELAVMTVYLANNAVDRDNERFSEGTLQRFAETLPGKSFLMAHDWGPPGVARFFDASLQQENELWLVGKIYLVREHHKQLIDEVRAGTWWAVSIGFHWAKIVPIGDDGEALVGDWEPKDVAYWEFQEDPDHDRLSEALEGSLVHLGAQYGASMGQAAKAYTEPMGSEDRHVKDNRAKPGWEETENEFRYRVRDPDLFSDCRSKWIQAEKPRVRAIYCKYKDKDEWAIQALRFPKDDGWTLKKAKKWLKDHPDILKEAKMLTKKEFENVDTVKFCPVCGEELTDKKECGTCEVQYVEKVAEPDDPETDVIKMLAVSSVSNNDSIKALADQMKALGEQVSTMAGRMDDATTRKGKAPRIGQIDDDGFMRVPVTGDAVGSLTKKDDAEYDKIFRVNQKTGRVMEGSLKKFYELHGIPDNAEAMSKHGAPGASPMKVKEQVMENLRTLLAAAFEWGVY